MNVRIIAISLTGTIGALIFFLYRSAAPDVPADETLPAPSSGNATERSSQPAYEADATRQPPSELPRYERPVRDARRAALVREALIARTAQHLDSTAAARNSTPKGNSPRPAPFMPEADGTDNQVGKPLGDYVNRIMQEQFVPMATECYATLLARNPTVAGNVELAFSILGDPSVGGVVVDVSLGQQTTLNDPEFRSCMTESMFAVVFDAPPGEDGSVSVVQSFELAP